MRKKMNCLSFKFIYQYIYNKMEPVKISYKDKLCAISTYYSVSEDASKYLYHRRRYGYPFKKPTDSMYLKWDNKLLNALIKADKIEGFNWDNLIFSNDIQTLLDNDINVESQSDNVEIFKGRNSASKTKSFEKYGEKNNEIQDDGWMIVTNNRGQLIRRNILRKMGFLNQSN